MNIRLEVVPHAQQRYDTCGDWFWGGDVMVIRCSKLSDPRYERLIQLHELVEMLLATQMGVTPEMVDAWDMQQEHAPGDNYEPGDDPSCPVFQQHGVAYACEYLAARLLGVDWNAYAKEIADL